MDSLTQIVLGAAVGEAAIGKKVGNWAMLWGAVAGTIPDLDVFAIHFTDNVTALEMHRGFSHSIVFSVLLAPIVGWVISKIHKKLDADWKDWTKLMFLALVTHPLLDAHTAWGTQLFWPFDLRIAYKNIFVVDPIYTIPFLTFLIIAMFYKRGTKKRRSFNNFGLLVSSTYMLITIGFKWITYNKFTENLARQNIEYLEVRTRPTIFNSILWSANVKTKDAFMVGYCSLFDNENEISFSNKFMKNHHLLGKMANEKKVKQLIKISEGWYTVEEREGKIIFNDLRFGQKGFDVNSSPFVFSFELMYNANNELQAIEVPKSFNDAGKLLTKLYARVLGEYKMRE